MSTQHENLSTWIEVFKSIYSEILEKYFPELKNINRNIIIETGSKEFTSFFLRDDCYVLTNYAICSEGDYIFLTSEIDKVNSTILSLRILGYSWIKYHFKYDVDISIDTTAIDLKISLKYFLKTLLYESLLLILYREKFHEFVPYLLYIDNCFKVLTAGLNIRDILYTVTGLTKLGIILEDVLRIVKSYELGTVHYIIFKTIVSTVEYSIITNELPKDLIEDVLKYKTPEIFHECVQHIFEEKFMTTLDETLGEAIKIKDSKIKFEERTCPITKQKEKSTIIKLKIR